MCFVKVFQNAGEIPCDTTGRIGEFNRIELSISLADLKVLSLLEDLPEGLPPGIEG
jgi:hypothetical protein